MKINLSKLMQLIDLVQNCPIGYPGRTKILLDAYTAFNVTSPNVVSIEVSPDLERLNERDIDSEDAHRRRLILTELILNYSQSFTYPEKPTTVFLLPLISRCPECDGELKIFKPSMLGRCSIAYTTHGPKLAHVYHKNCSKCQITAYYCYFEKKNGMESFRKYYEHEMDFFIVTQDTYFSVQLLHELTLDLFIMDVNFLQWVEKYNTLHCNDPSMSMYRKRIIPVWLFFSIKKRLSLEFPVLRNADRNLDVEGICRLLYPKLKQIVDKKWVDHVCEGCSSRLVVMDGNQKCFRNVCASRGEKIVSRGQLNEFTGNLDHIRR